MIKHFRDLEVYRRAFAGSNENISNHNGFPLRKNIL